MASKHCSDCGRKLTVWNRVIGKNSAVERVIGSSRDLCGNCYGKKIDAWAAQESKQAEPEPAAHPSQTGSLNGAPLISRALNVLSLPFILGGALATALQLKEWGGSAENLVNPLGWIKFLGLALSALALGAGLRVLAAAFARRKARDALSRGNQRG
jgi:hypothetical protein